MDWTVVLPVLLEHAVIPLLVAAGAWLVTKLPGPVRDWLNSGTHQRDMALVLGALARGALAAKASGFSNVAAADEAVTYVRQNLPDTLAKMAPTVDTLRTMALAAVEQAAQGKAEVTQ